MFRSRCLSYMVRTFYKSLSHVRNMLTASYPPRFSRDSPLPALLIRRLQIIVINITHSACAIKRLNSFSLDNQKEKLHALNRELEADPCMSLDKEHIEHISLSPVFTGFDRFFISI